MKFSVSSYSFKAYLNDGKLTVKECISKAKELGFDAIEFIDGAFPEGQDPLSFAAELKAEADRVGIEISNLAVGADLLNGDVAAQLETLKKWVDVAVVLGCKTVRHDVTGGVKEGRFRSYQAVLPQLADACRTLTEYAAAKGIKTMTENHGFFSQDSDRVEALINLVDHDNFGQLVDLGNFLCADEDPLKAVGRCAPYAFYVHAKDFVVKPANEPDPGEGFFQSRGANYLKGTIVGHGAVPIVPCLRILKKAGFDGYAAIEFEGMEDSIRALEIGLSNLKRYAALAGY